MKSKKEIIIMTMAVILFIVLAGFKSTTTQSKWIAPKSADEIKNPLKDDAVATKKGKKMYTQLCLICHGSKGKGDGIAGMALNPKPANFNSKAFFNQTDGAIFWKITEGNAPMASYKDLISKEERWQLINYIRTFKKK